MPELCLLYPKSPNRPYIFLAQDIKDRSVGQPYDRRRKHFQYRVGY